MVEKYRGLFVCPKYRKAVNADLVAALNILHNGKSTNMMDSRNESKTEPLNLLLALAGTLTL